MSALTIHLQRTTSHLGRTASAAGLVTAALGVAACTSQSNQSAASAATARQDAVDRLDSASAVVKEFRDQIPDAVARETRCVIAVPSLAQGGAIVGIQKGSGFATCRTENGWSAAAPIRVTGGSLGAQIGAESVDVLTLVMTDRAEASLLGGHFRIGVDASAAAGPVGGRGMADFKLGGEVVSYTRQSGLYAGVAMTGATVDRDDDATRALYGALPDLRAILDGQQSEPAVPAAQRFVATVRTQFGMPAPVSERRERSSAY